MQGTQNKQPFKKLSWATFFLLCLLFLGTSYESTAQSKKGSNKPWNHKSRNKGSKQDSEKNKVGKKKKKKKKSKTARKENKGSNKPWNHKSRNTGARQVTEKNKTGQRKTSRPDNNPRNDNSGSSRPFNYKGKSKGTRQDIAKDKTGRTVNTKTRQSNGKQDQNRVNSGLKNSDRSKTPNKSSDKHAVKSNDRRKNPTTKGDDFAVKSKNRQKQPTTKGDEFAVKSKNRQKQPSTRHDDYSMKSKNRQRKPTTKGDEFAVKSKNRQKQPTMRHQDYSMKSTNRQRKPNTPQNKHGVGMIKVPRTKNKQPIDLTKTTVKVPVINYRKTDMHRIRHQEKLKTAAMPPRRNPAPTDKTYMIKVKRSHDNGALPKKNPVEWSLKRSQAKSYKNPRPEISKYHGNLKRPTKLYQEFLNWKKSRELLNHSGKLSIAKPANSRKQYRKLGRKLTTWQGEIKVLRRYKHQHPSLRFQVRPHKPKGADVRRNNKKLKKAKYNPNERKIWEPEDDYSTY